MRRRDFGKSISRRNCFKRDHWFRKCTGLPSRADFPKAPGLTEYVGEFVWQTKYEDIPGEVIELGKSRSWMAWDWR